MIDMIPKDIFYWLSIAGWGIGVAVLVYALLAGLAGLLSRRRQPRLNILLAYDEDHRRKKPVQMRQAVSMDDLIGMDGVPWAVLYLVGALAAFGMYALIEQVWVLLLAVLPFLYRMWLARYRQRGLMQTMWQFLMDIRIRLTLQGTLLLTLRDVAEHNPNPIAQAVRKYLDAGYRESGIEILKHLRVDLPDLPFLPELLARAEAASSGTLDMDTALRQVMEGIQREANTQAKESLQKIPSRLILMAFPALLMPALFLLIFPLAARLIASLQGATWGGGF